MPNWFEGEAQAGSDYSGTVASCEFTEGKFGYQAILRVALDDPITKNDGTLMTEMPAFYGLPNGWLNKDGRLVHESGDLDKLLPQSNKFQKVVKAAGDCGSLAVAYLTRDGLTPYMEEAWVGARFHFMTIEAGQDYNIPARDGEPAKSGKTKGFPAPTEWLGTKDNPIGGSVGASVASTVDATSVLAEVGLDSDTFDVLSGLAQTETPDKFVTDAMAHREGASNAQAFIKHLGSGALYAALREE